MSAAVLTLLRVEFDQAARQFSGVTARKSGISQGIGLNTEPYFRSRRRRRRR